MLLYKTCQEFHFEFLKTFSSPPCSNLLCSHSFLEMIALCNWACLELLERRAIRVEGNRSPGSLLKTLQQARSYLKSGGMSTNLTRIKCWRTCFYTFRRCFLKTAEGYEYKNPATVYLWGVCQINWIWIFWTREIPCFGEMCSWKQVLNGTYSW